MKKLSKQVDRIEGVVLGTAIGDALGFPVEFLHVPDIEQLYGRVRGFEIWQGRRKESDYALYTDDTQMFRAVCDGLLLSETWTDIDKAGKWVARKFVRWLRSPENTRAPGSSCIAGCKNLEHGVEWRESGVESGGCGAAMRSMAYGLWLDDPGEASQWAAEHAVMTHNTPMAQASAAAVAAIVAALRKGVSPARAVQVGTLMAAKYDSATGAMLVEAHSEALKVRVDSADPERLVEPREITRQIILDKWRGWSGHEAVAAAAFCFLAYPTFEEAVLAAVNSSGDSDSLGAITGAFAGAYQGATGINLDWIDKIEKTDELQDLAMEICQAKKLS